LGEGGCLDGVRSGAQGVRAHVADSDGLPGGSCGGHRGRRRRLARIYAADEAATNLIGSSQVSASECPGSFDQSARAVVIWGVRRIHTDNALGAVGGPYGD
jgi:hypothetical protein